MARIDNLKNFLTDVATAIRNKKGTSDVIKASSFDMEINNLPSEEISDFFSSSIKTNTQSPSNGNSLAGLIKKLPDDLMFTNPTSNLRAVNLFSYGELLKEVPMMDISNATSTKAMFYNCRLLETIPELNTSSVTNMQDMFWSCETITNIPSLDTSNVTVMSNMFSYCKSLISVPVLDTTKVVNVMNMFNACGSLKDLGGLKNLGKAYLTTQSANYSNYKLNLSYCTNLTYESLMNVINNLYDIASLGVQTQTLTLGEINLAKLTDEEIAIATNKGWTVS